MGSGFHFKSQRFVVTDNRFVSHGQNSGAFWNLARDGNWKILLGLRQTDLTRGALIGCGSLRLQIPLGVSLGGHLVEKCCAEPSREDD